MKFTTNGLFVVLIEAMIKLLFNTRLQQYMSKDINSNCHKFSDWPNHYVGQNKGDIFLGSHFIYIDGLRLKFKCRSLNGIQKCFKICECLAVEII